MPTNTDPTPQAAASETPSDAAAAAQPNPQITGFAFLSELALPGASHLLAGRWKQGIGYAAVGSLLMATAGYPVAFVASAASFSQSVTGQDPLGLSKLRAAVSEIGPSAAQPGSAG